MFHYRAWEMWLVLLVIYSAWICPFQFAFITYKKDAIFIIDNIVNGFFAIDIVLTFFVAYLDSQSYLLVDNPKKIAIRWENKLSLKLFYKWIRFLKKILKSVTFSDTFLLGSPSMCVPLHRFSHWAFCSITMEAN